MKIATSIAIILAIIMTALELAFSWSQLHLTKFEPLLYATLSAISLAFICKSFTDVNRNKKVFKRIRVRDLDFTTGVLFLCVMIFGVNSEVLFIEKSHLVFTGLAILIAYLNMVLEANIIDTNEYSETYKKLMQQSTRAGFVLVLISFPLGLLTDLYNTGTAELIATIPLGIRLLTTKTINNG